MGDRTTVTLTVRGCDSAIVKSLSDFNDKFTGETVPNQSQTIRYTYFDVNYSELEFENELQNRQIAYDKDWDAGDEYAAGCDYFRIDSEGNGVLKTFYQGEHNMVALVDVIHAHENNNLDALIKIKSEEFSIISWDEQSRILTELKNQKEKN